jgi:hypothetical protein
MKKDGLQRLLEFLDILDEADVTYRIERQTPDELLVTFARHGARAEVMFSVDEMLYSLFHGDERSSVDEAALKAFIADRWSDD